MRYIEIKNCKECPHCRVMSPYVFGFDGPTPKEYWCAECSEYILQEERGIPDFCPLPKATMIMPDREHRKKINISLKEEKR